MEPFRPGIRVRPPLFRSRPRGPSIPGWPSMAPQRAPDAANGAGSGSVDVFDSAFAPVSLAAGAFVDPSLPSGLVPFNVRNIGGDVFVVYAPAGRANDIIAPYGAGVVAVFDED